MVLPRRMARGEQGRDFKPPMVPRSISLMKEVVKESTPAKNKMTQRAAEVTSGPRFIPPLQAKLQIRTEPTEKARMEKTS